MIRFATTDDLPSIVALMREFYEKTPYSEHLPFSEDKSIETALQILDMPKERGIVLVLDNGGVQGIFAGIMMSGLCSSTEFANELIWYVREGYRGKEGLELHEAFTFWAKKVQAPVMTMTDISGGSNLDKFYKKHDYVNIERIQLKVI